MSDALVERLTGVLLSEGAGPGSSLHSWRCEYPDRYGECDCVMETAKELAAVVEQEIAAARAEALREADVTWRRRALLAEEAIRRAMRLYHEAVREGVTLQPTAIRDALAPQVIEAQTPATSPEASDE